jgi:hypothetical protein
MGEAEHEIRVTLQNAPEHEGRGGNGGVEGVADETLAIEGLPAIFSGRTTMKVLSSSVENQFPDDRKEAHYDFEWQASADTICFDNDQVG